MGKRMRAASKTATAVNLSALAVSNERPVIVADSTVIEVIATLPTNNL